MRYISFIIALIGINAGLFGQVDDFQLRVRTTQNPDSILIMSNDTNSSSATYKTGKWRKASDIIGAVTGDTDWYKLGGTLIPTNSDSAYRSGYTLFTGLNGGVATMIEMLKDGTFQMDSDDGSAGDGRVYMRMNPYTSANNNTSFNFSMTRQDNAGIDRDNDVFNMGFNLSGGGQLERDNIGESAMGLSFENLYRTAGSDYSEFHLFFIDTNNVQWRPFTVYLNRYDPDLWTGSFHMPAVNFRPSGDVDEYFQFRLVQDSLARMTMKDPIRNTGITATVNAYQKQIEWTTTMGSGSTWYGNAFDYTVFKYLLRTHSFGSIATTIAGNDGAGWFTNIGTGWGIDLTSGNLVVDSSQVATQYDLTTISMGGDDWGADVVNHDLTLTGNGTVGTPLGVDTSEIATQYDLTLISSGATDLTIGGSGPTYTIESSTGTDVTIEANPGLYLTESPANNLVISNDGVVSGANSSAATTHTLELLDWTGGVALGSLQLAEGTGVTLTTTGTTSNGIVTIASTVTDTDDQNLTIEGAGPTYDIAIDGGTDVTIAGGGIVTLSETPANTLVITATEVDGSTSNEIQDITVTGASQPFTLDLGSDATDATFTGAGITTVTRSTNALTFTSTEVDGSTTNETNTIEEGNVSVQSGNLNIDFQSMFDVATDGGTEVNVSFDGGEATTVTTPESDDYLLMHDSGSSANQKILWTDIIMDIISFYDGTVLQGTGNAVDVGEGLDINMVVNEANINLDASEFQIDGTGEGTEYVLIHDVDTTAGHQIQRRLVSSFGGGTDTNFALDDLTFDANRTHDMDVYSLTLTGTATNVYIQEENGGSGNMLVLVSELGAGTGITGGVSFQSENSGTPTEQYDVESYKWSTDQSTFKISGEQATDAEITYEKNADLANNTTESHLSINGGIAFTQNYDGSTGGSDLNLDRSYYTVNITGGNLTDTIKLPEVAQTTDNWSSSLTSTQCQVGQEYVISNLRSGVNLVIGAYNPAGTSDDLIGTRTAPGGAAGSAISIAPGKSAIIKCYQLAGGIGYWSYWLSN